MKRQPFIEWENDIRSYCDTNGLDFRKARNLPKCWNQEWLALVYHDPEKGKSGLLDDTPSPAALIITRRRDGTLDFEQTEYTQRCLGMNP